jgi:hypothetical protein
VRDSAGESEDEIRRRVCAKIGETNEVSLGDDKGMDRRLRPDVMKRQGEFVFENFLAGNFASQNLSENIVLIVRWLATDDHVYFLP